MSMDGLNQLKGVNPSPLPVCAWLENVCARSGAHELHLSVGLETEEGEAFREEMQREEGLCRAGN